MPSTKALTNVTVGAGKLHPNVATAAADLGNSGAETWLVSTLGNLALSGLQERYNRSATVTGSPTPGPGEGAVIERSGQAVTLQGTAGTYDYSTPHPDNYQALYLTRAGPAALTSTITANKDGGSGFVGVLQQRVTASSSYLTNAACLSAASRMDLIEWALDASNIGLGQVRTKVDPTNTTGTALNPDGGAGDASRTIRLGTGDFFWETTSGSDLSNVAIGHDMVEITTSGGVKQTYVITKLFGGPHPSSPAPLEDHRRALVRTLTGDTPDFGFLPVTGVSFRFIKTKFFSGVGAQQYREKVDAQTDPVLLGYEYHARTPPLTTEPGALGSSESEPGPLAYFASGRTKGDTELETPKALVFGGYNPNSHYQELGGALRGDGAVEASLVNKKVHTESISVGGTLTWHPTIQGSVLEISFTHGSGTVNLTVALDSDYTSNVLMNGDELTIVIRNSPSAPTQGGGGGTALVNITWPSEFQFSGSDERPARYNDSSGATVSKYHGVYLDSLSKFLMTLTTYLGPGD